MEDKEVEEICCTTVRIYSTLMDCILRMVKMVNYVTCFFFNHNFKRLPGKMKIQNVLFYQKGWKRKVIHMRRSTCNTFILDMQEKAISESTNLKQAAVYG